MNYIKGDEFLFTCSATNVDALVFLANGTQPSADQEFIQTQSIIPDGLSTSSLTGMALIQHNNTNISCVGPVFGEDEVISRIAVLLVQGDNDNNYNCAYKFYCYCNYTIIVYYHCILYRSIIISCWFIIFFH